MISNPDSDSGKSNAPQVESDDGGHLESIDALGPGRRILIKGCNQALTVKR